jgi:hypothetical protein
MLTLETLRLYSKYSLLGGRGEKVAAAIQVCVERITKLKEHEYYGFDGVPKRIADQYINGPPDTYDNECDGKSMSLFPSRIQGNTVSI